MITPTPIVITVAAQPVPDMARLLRCIGQVERVRGSHRRGHFGERGKYQFTEATWKSVTSIPFDEAENDQVSDNVARFYLNKLRYQLLERRIDATVYNIAMAFHCGLNGAVLRTFQSQDAKEYCIRVENLYCDR
jgi:hypothetical protein